MNKRLGIVIIFALVVSIAASAVVYRIISAKLGLTPKSSALPLMVASRDLPPGTLISAPDVRSVNWSGYVPPRALRTTDQVVGRAVIQAVYEGDPMLETRLAPRGAGGGLAATIPQGMRAVAVRVDEVVGVSGFVVPGMKVDVLVSGAPPSASGADTPNKISKIVLQNIAVLSAGQNMQKDAEGKPVTVQVVNLLVTPEQAERLSLASNETKIQLVLRNPLDTTDVKTNGVALAALFSDGQVTVPAVLRSRPSKPVQVAAPAVVRGPVEQPFVVEILRGSERASVRFNAPQQAN
jgi:pilus assembly protein CpaB